MSMLVVGLSHRSAPVTLLERAAVTGDDLVKLLHEIHRAPNIGEAMVVSTCNRVEVYASVDKFHAGVSTISDLLCLSSGVPHEDLCEHLYVHYEDRAVQHIFSVICGLESMVVGEGQIIGQVRQALRLAQDEGTVARDINEVVQQALRVGKRAHHETGIDRAGASLVSVGLDLAAEHLGPLAGRRALIVGAGSMSALAAATLDRAGIGEIVIANRTYSRGAHLAASLTAEARAVHLDDLGEALAAADLIVSCTGATGIVITADQLAAGAAQSTAVAQSATADQGTAVAQSAAVDQRPGAADLPAADRGEKVFLLDLALPHDVDKGVTALPGVALAGLDELRFAERAAEAIGADAVEAVRKIVADEVSAFLGNARAAAVAPTVVALRSKAADVVESELQRLTGRLPELDDRTRKEINQTVRRVVDKLLHAPTVRVKELAAGPGGDAYAAALRELFDLDPKAPEAVARADVGSPAEGNDR